MLNRLSVGAVCLNGFAAPPKRGDFIGDGLGFIGGFFIGDNYIGACAGQRQRNGAPQTTAGSGDQRLFTC
ncbi:hypothetical protein D3C78_1142530 [compost metagenome]